MLSSKNEGQQELQASWSKFQNQARTGPPADQSSKPGSDQKVMPSDDFTALRPKLLAIAYRMLGSVEDAEDVVQDAYFIWDRAVEIQDPEAWLVKVTTNRCIDKLRQRQKQNAYPGAWLPEPVSEQWPGGTADAVELAESLSMAFLLLLETLTPAERAAFLLREAFGYGFDQIALLLDKSAGNVRQLVTRARQRVAHQDRRFHPDRPQAEKLADEFFAACRSGDLQKIEAMLASDVVLLSDGGGVVHAARSPIRGTARIAKLLAITFRKAREQGHESVVTVNGQPGVALHTSDGNTKLMSYQIVSGRIQQIYFVLNPDKLRRWNWTDHGQAVRQFVPLRPKPTL